MGRLTKLVNVLKGGPGSGNFGHAGIPGQRGGSAPGGGGGGRSGGSKGGRKFNANSAEIHGLKMQETAVDLRMISGSEERFEANLKRAQSLKAGLESKLKQAVKEEKKAKQEYRRLGGEKGGMTAWRAGQKLERIGAASDELMSAIDEMDRTIQTLGGGSKRRGRKR